MRDVSPRFMSYIRELDNDDLFVYLFTFEHDNQVHLRLTTAAEPIISRGNTFEPSPVSVRPPQSSLARGRTDGRLTIENVSRQSVQWIRTADASPDVIMEGVFASSPSVLEMGPVRFKMGKVIYSEEDMAIPLIRDELFKKPFQEIQFDPSRTPALYA